MVQFSLLGLLGSESIPPHASGGTRAVVLLPASVARKGALR
jgi:hypothetical protein